MGFGNLRTLLWLAVASLPILGTTWTLAVLTASENAPTLSYMLSVAVVGHAVFSLVGYCFVNSRVRRNLYLSLLKCVGKKAPLNVGMLNGASSNQNITTGISVSDGFSLDDFEFDNLQGIRNSYWFLLLCSGLGSRSRRHTEGPTQTRKELTSVCRRAAPRLGVQIKQAQVPTEATRVCATRPPRPATTTATAELSCLSEAIIQLSTDAITVITLFAL